MPDVDFSLIQEGDLLTFDDGTVALVRGVLDQEDQWVFQLHTGEDFRVSKLYFDDAHEESPTE